MRRNLILINFLKLFTVCCSGFRVSVLLLFGQSLTPHKLKSDISVVFPRGTGFRTVELITLPHTLPFV